MMVDVKDPTMNYSWSAHHHTLNLRKTPIRSTILSVRARAGIRIFALCAGVLLLTVGGYEAYMLIHAKQTLQVSGAAVESNFSHSVEAMKELNPEEASETLRINAQEMTRMQETLAKSNAWGIMGVLGKFIPAFSEARSLIGATASLNLNFLDLAEATTELKQNGFTAIQSNGAALLSMLSRMRAAIQNIIADAQTAKNATANLSRVSSYFGSVDAAVGNSYLAHSADLYRAHAFLDNVITLLSAERERHLLFLFQNPAEIRPGGGFIGSYADVTVAGGQMKSIDVRDIYDPDGQFFEKIIPPYQLQTVSEKWGARDANWFFDFPTSAKTVIQFLESSRMYEERNTTFDAAIAINIPVIQSILKATGPIPLPEYNLSITSDNFLTEVQREVEAGKDKTAGQPKKILKVLAPLLLEKMRTVDEQAKRALMQELGSRIAKKDIMFYAKDADIMRYFAEENIGGAVYELPQKFFGSYLAIVNANVAGGKTDALMRQSITATINVDTAGSTLTDLTVTRTHEGGDKKDPWWNADNKNFIQVLTNPDASLVSMKGNSIKKIVPAFNYQTGGFSANEDLARIDDSRVLVPNANAWTMKEFGKTSFATWFMVPAKKTGNLTLRYHTDNTALTPPEAGDTFTFVYERQSGVPTALSITIAAPVGFIWKESGTPTFTYTNDDPDGRTIVTLVLQHQ